jgi:hypothetical protein
MTQNGNSLRARRDGRAKTFHILSLRANRAAVKRSNPMNNQETCVFQQPANEMAFRLTNPQAKFQIFKNALPKTWRLQAAFGKYAWCLGYIWERGPFVAIILYGA